MTAMDHSPAELSPEITQDRDMAEHLRTYARFKQLATWAAIALPFFFAFVLYYTQ